MNINPRDFIGYGLNTPNINWPGSARIAVQFVLNLEEGAENCVLNGDEYSETFLCDIFDAKAYTDRHMSVESLFEYGSRVGFKRILDEFTKRNLPLTIFACGLSLQLNRPIIEALVSDKHEIAGHGWRWINYQKVSQLVERNHIIKTVEIIKEITGESPVGWYTGRDSPNTRKLLIEQKCFLYDSDYYGDELPFWYAPLDSDTAKKNHLIIPYSLDCNDMRFFVGNGFNISNDFFEYLKDSFDFLYKLGEMSPKIMTIGLHSRIIARPGRFISIQRFIDYIQRFDNVWITRRRDIAEYWIKNHK